MSVSGVKRIDDVKLKETRREEIKKNTKTFILTERALKLIYSEGSLSVWIVKWHSHTHTLTRL